MLTDKEKAWLTARHESEPMPDAIIDLKLNRPRRCEICRARQTRTPSRYCSCRMNFDSTRWKLTPDWQDTAEFYAAAAADYKERYEKLIHKIMNF